MGQSEIFASVIDLKRDFIRYGNDKRQGNENVSKACLV